MSKPVLISNNHNKTRKQLVEEIYINNPTLTKKQLWNKAVDDLYKAGMSINLAIARTYIWSAEQKHAKKLNPAIQLKTRNIDSTKLKKTKAYTLFESNLNLNRKEMISLIETTLGITNTSAQTHCSLSAKRFSKNHPTLVHKAIIKT